MVIMVVGALVLASLDEFEDSGISGSCILVLMFYRACWRVQIFKRIQTMTMGRNVVLFIDNYGIG